jgi:toxin-antitoxin system PIN domain toxin
MPSYLLDANVVIAATVAEHEHHERVSSWLASVDQFALCPVVEGALVRFLVRLGESVTVGRHVLEALRAHDRSVFWPDSVSYAEIDLGHVRGHRQVTDAYLVGLAEHHGGTLATLDKKLATEVGDRVLLVP